MATKAMSKNGTRPGYEFGSIWRWIDYPAHDLVGESFPYNDAYEGFAIEVLVNPRGEQERAIELALREHIRRLQELTQSDPDNQEAVDASERVYLEAIAPRVRSWNAVSEGEPLAAPATIGGFEVFCDFPEHLRQWIPAVVRNVSIPKRPIRSSSRVGSTASTPAGPTMEPPPLDRQES